MRSADLPHRHPRLIMNKSGTRPQDLRGAPAGGDAIAARLASLQISHACDAVHIAGTADGELLQGGVAPRDGAIAAFRAESELAGLSEVLQALREVSDPLPSPARHDCPQPRLLLPARPARPSGLFSFAALWLRRPSAGLCFMLSNRQHWVCAGPRGCCCMARPAAASRQRCTRWLASAALLCTSLPLPVLLVPSQVGQRPEGSACTCLC